MAEGGRRWGVLVMAHGTPPHPGDIERFYTEIRRGRPPPPELLADLEARYRAIGGVSPLAERTQAQVAAISRALAERQGAQEDAVPVELGQKFADPRIEDGVARLAQQGVDQVVGFVLAPHYSALSVGEYHRRAGDAAIEAGLRFSPVERWGTEAELVEALSERVTAVWPHAAERAGTGGRVELLVTAHSLPERCRDLDDPSYPDQLAATAEAVARAAGVASWRVVWQSAGRTPEPWLGPDLLDVLRTLPSEGVGAAVVCPAGFTSDHLEVLYDIDIEAQAVAEEAGIALVRTRSLNDDPALARLAARLATEAAAP